MVPLRRIRIPVSGREAWPGTGSQWHGLPARIGFGPRGERLALFQSRVREDRMLAHRLDGDHPVVVLDDMPHLEAVQPLPDGKVLLIGRHRTVGRENAQIRDADGRLITSAFVGHDPRHVLTTPSGSTWIGYGETADDDLGLHKLVRLDDELRPQWWYPYASERPDLPTVFDVYALNVTGETAWCYAYTDFHLVQAFGDTVTDLGPAPPGGARAVVVDGGRGALVGGYGPEHDVIRPFHLRPGGFEVGAPVGRLVLPEGDDVGALGLTARGADLYARSGNSSLYRVTLEELLDGPRA
jgi:hypothetical protein